MSSESMPPPLSPTPRTTIRRKLRAVTKREELYGLLDASLIVHVSVPGPHAPLTLPMAFGRKGDTVYLHGAVANGLIRRAVEVNAEVCLSATLVDALVLARSAFHHSMNYRSAVAFGPLREVTDDAEKRDALDRIVNHALPGRSDECRPASESELKATRVVAFELSEVSMKIRRGPPVDDESDLSLPYWAGVIRIERNASAPDDAPDLADETERMPATSLELAPKF